MINDLWHQLSPKTIFQVFNKMKYAIQFDNLEHSTTAQKFVKIIELDSPCGLRCIALLISIYEVNSPPPLASAHAQAAHTKYVPFPPLSLSLSDFLRLSLSLSLSLSYASKCLTSAKTIRYEVCLHFRKFCTLAITTKQYFCNVKFYWICFEMSMQLWNTTNIL